MEYGYPGDSPNNIPLPGTSKPEHDKARDNVKAALSKIKEGLQEGKKDFAGYEILSFKDQVDVEGLGQFHDGYDFILKDNESGKEFRLLFRASGTEPLFKAYFSWQNPIKSSSVQELNQIIEDTDAYVQKVSAKLKDAFQVMAGDLAMSTNTINNVDTDEENWGAQSTETMALTGKSAAMIIEPGQESTEPIARPTAEHSITVTMVDLPNEAYTISVHPTKEDKLVVYDPNGKRIEPNFGSSTISVLAGGGVFDVVDEGFGITIKNHSRGMQLEVGKSAAMTAFPNAPQDGSRWKNRMFKFVALPAALLTLGAISWGLQSSIKDLFEITYKSLVELDRQVKKIQNNQQNPGDRALLNGGIDLNSKTLNLESSGQKVNINFNPAIIAQFKRGDFSGVKIQVLEVVPISLVALLGLKEYELAGNLAKA